MSYRTILTRQTGVWAVTASMTRLPVAMAPLAMVFLGHGATGGYSTGSVLAAFFIAGEVAQTPRRSRPRTVGRGLRWSRRPCPVGSRRPDGPVAVRGLRR